jgi:hypothetical protein
MGNWTALHIETHGVHNALAIHYGGGDRAIVINVGMDWRNTEPNVGENGCGAFWMPRCDPHRKTTVKQTLDKAPPRKSVPPNAVTFLLAIVRFLDRCRHAGSAASSPRRAATVGRRSVS